MDINIDVLKNKIIQNNDYIKRYKLIEEYNKNIAKIILYLETNRISEALSYLKNMDRPKLEELFFNYLFVNDRSEVIKQYIGAIDCLVLNKKESKSAKMYDLYYFTKQDVKLETSDSFEKYGRLNTISYREMIDKIVDKELFFRMIRVLLDYDTVIKKVGLINERLELKKYINKASKQNLLQFNLDGEDTFKLFYVNIASLYCEIQGKLSDMKKQVNNKIKEINQLNEELKLMLLIKNKLGRCYITNSDINKIINNKLRKEVVIQILEDVVLGNQRYIERKVSHFGSKEYLKYVLKKFGYDYEKLDRESQDKLKTMKFEKIWELEKINDINIKLTYANLNLIIKRGIVEEVDKLKVWLQKDYIDEVFINKYPMVLTDTNLLKVISENIKTLKYYKYKIKSNNREILLCNSEELKMIFKLYKIYNIDVVKIPFPNVIDVNNFDKIDRFIEEGYFDLVQNKPHYFYENSHNIIKRIHINNLLGEESVGDDDILDDVRTGKNFLVPINRLDDFYINSSINVDMLKNMNKIEISDDIINSKAVKVLDDKYLTDFNYNINGVIISRPKVLRCLESLKNMSLDWDIKLMTSIMYNTYLTVDEVKNINKSVKNSFQNHTFVV